MLKVLLPTDGETAYKVAGEAFCDMAEKVTGVRPETVSAYEPGCDLAVIGSDCVNEFAAKAIDDDLIDSFGIRYGTDDYALRSVERDGNTWLFLAGGCGRSTVYAVYDYFERRLGCHYFWDGDVIGRADGLPLGGLNVVESPRFNYRGLRYFAHRGLHRYQAEHWSLSDWKREIDWMMKRRLNFFMLRIGMDDVFQRAFPDIVDYPSPTRKPPESAGGYDDRTLFWPLEYRSELRKKILEYARDRGLVHGEDFGTMTHWYSRTPVQYLEKKKPVLLAQESVGYNQRTGLCWDPRVDENLENYMKLTDVYANYYGRPELFHTIGLAERFIFKERGRNMKMKIYTYRRTLQKIRQRYPNSRQLLAAWDFIGWWKPDEIKTLIRELDPEHQIILDYMCDHDDPEQSFLNWGVVGGFPWIVGIFHAFEAENDIRGPYALTQRRLETAAADDFCKGMVLWPELSHSDTLMLEYFARNSWRPDRLAIAPLAEAMCADRYGEAARRMNAIWQRLLPVTDQVGWGVYSRRGADDPECPKYSHNWNDNFTAISRIFETGACLRHPSEVDVSHWKYMLSCAHETARNGVDVLEMIAGLSDADLGNRFIARDAVDIAQTVVGRYFHWAVLKLFVVKHGFDVGGSVDADVTGIIAAHKGLSDAMTGVMGCHADYSMHATLTGLNEVCAVAPAFESTLKRNLVNGYCRQPAFEPCKYLYRREHEVFFDWFRKNLDAGVRGAWDDSEPLKAKAALFDEFMARPLAEMRPTGEGDVRVSAGQAARFLPSLGI